GLCKLLYNKEVALSMSRRWAKRSGGARAEVGSQGCEMLIALDRLTEIVPRQSEIVWCLDDHGGANADLAKSLHGNLSRSLKLIQAVMETRRPVIEKWATTEAEIAHRRDRNVARALQLIQRSECSVELAH